MNHKQRIDLIVSLVETYFEGLYQADEAILSPLFHSDARYVNTVENDYQSRSIEDYLSIVSKRVSPAKTFSPRDEQIISIEHDGKNMAFVKLSMLMMGRRYLDYLTLIYVNKRWQIISKTFSYKMLEGG